MLIILSSTYGSKTLTIYDNDGINEFSVEAIDTSVTEGEFARFLISRTKTREQGSYVALSYTGGIGDFIFGNPNYSTFYIYPARNSRVLYVPTVDDEIDEPNGSVKVTLFNCI